VETLPGTPFGNGRTASVPFPIHSPEEELLGPGFRQTAGRSAFGGAARAGRFLFLLMVLCKAGESFLMQRWRPSCGLRGHFSALVLHLPRPPFSMLCEQALLPLTEKDLALLLFFLPLPRLPSDAEGSLKKIVGSFPAVSPPKLLEVDAPPPSWLFWRKLFPFFSPTRSPRPPSSASPLKNVVQSQVDLPFLGQRLSFLRGCNPPVFLSFAFFLRETMRRSSPPLRGL